MQELSLKHAASGIFAGLALFAALAANAQVTFCGKVESVAAPSLAVAGRTVVTTAATTFTKGGAAASFGDIALGDPATVTGLVQADATVVASTIVVAPCTISLSGSIEAIGADGITIGGIPMRVDANTVIRRGDAIIKLTDLKVGEPATAQALAEADGSLLATLVQVAPQIVTLSGLIGSIDTSRATLTIGGTPVVYDANTQVEGCGNPHSLADLHVGDFAIVEATMQADGSLRASKLTRDHCSFAFSAFLAKVEADDESRGFEAMGSFTLAPASDGIDPATQPVHVEVGAFLADFAAGKLRAAKKGGSWSFEGMAGGSSVELRIHALGKGRYAFNLEAKHAGLGATAATVPVRLVIGNDGGVTDALVTD